MVLNPSSDSEQHSIPILGQLPIVVDEYVSESGHFTPWDVRVFFSKRHRNLFGGFTKDFKASNYGINSLSIGLK
jgi:hypothetical protein